MLQSMGWQRVRLDLAAKQPSYVYFIVSLTCEHKLCVSLPCKSACWLSRHSVKFNVC